MADAEKIGMTTIGTQLKWGTSKESLAKVVDIKDFPDLQGEPERVDVTTLSHRARVYVEGVKDSDSLAFTVNYLKDTYMAVEDDAGEQLYYELAFGNAGDEGIFEWEGTHSVSKSGGSVNDPNDMVITVIPSTEVTLKRD